MVPESELLKRVRVILSTSDLNTTSAGAVRRQLESDLGLDLSDHKKLISRLIDDIIHEEEDNVKEEEEEDNVKEEEDDGEVEVEDADAVEPEADNCQSPDTDTATTNSKKGKGTGFTRLCSLSPQLQDFVGVSEMARTEVVKRLWAYIRDNNLQDPNNRRNIKCDPILHSIFRVNTINMFQMNKVLSKHIWPLETPTPTPNAVECSVSSLPRQDKKQKRPKEEDDADEDKPKKKAKQHKGGTSGFLAPLPLSEAFVKFLGTGETTLSRSEAVKRIWEYIKQNNLQDPSDKRRILCDEKLKELFEVDTFHGFSVTKYLTAHLRKAEQ